MADSTSRAALQAFRAYVEEHSDRIIQRTLRGAPSLRYFTPIAGVRGELILEHRTMDKVVKRWNNTFGADNDIFQRNPVTIKSYFHTAELTFSPKEDFYTYKGTADKVRVKGHDYPYAQWALDKATQKIRTQMEFDQVFTGVQDNGANTASDIFDGLLPAIAADQALGTPKLTPTNTGPLAAATIIDQLESVDDSVDEEFKEEGMIMLSGPKVFKTYRRAYREKAGFHPFNEDTDSMQEIMLDGSSTKLVNIPGMRNSDRVILTHESNLYYSYDSERDYANWEFELDHRNIDAWCDYWFGAGFFVLDPKLVYINNQT